MKKSLTLITIFLVLLNSIKAQDKYKETALFNANAMISAFNNKDYVRYADFLTPEQYPFADKTLLYNTWKKVIENETRSISNLKLERFGIYNGTQQAYFTMKFGNNNMSLFGISSDSGSHWFFTQFIGNFNYDQIKKMMMPQLDSSFSDLDPNYSKRISFNKGDLIRPFEYEDIHGVGLNSEQLKGKVIVLNFWSTSCAPCIKEMPNLNMLVDKMKNKDIIFIAPAFSSSKDELLNSFLPKHPFSYKIITLKAEDYNVTVLPTHIIVDRNQKIIEKFEGGSDENLIKMETLLKNL